MMNGDVVLFAHRYDDVVVIRVYAEVLAVIAEIEIVTRNIDAVEHRPYYWFLQQMQWLRLR